MLRFSAGAYYWHLNFYSSKKRKKNPDDLPLFSFPHFAQIYQNQEARGSRPQKQTLHPEYSC